MNIIFNPMRKSYNMIMAFTVLLCCTARIGAQCPGNPPGDQAAYGQNEWIGYLYTGFATGNPPPDAFSGTYQGYITETETFNHAFPEPFTDANLCGSYSDNFAIRYKMEKTFSPGFYRLIFGGDDGYRLSIDGGATFPTALSSEYYNHGYYTSAQVVYLSGTIQFVLEYYEAGGGAQVSFNYQFMDCTSTAPTSISGDTTVYSCASSTTLTAEGGINGVGGGYQWGTGSIIGENIIAGLESQSITVSPTATTTYWVRRYAAYECAGPTEGVSTTVTYINSTPGDYTQYGDNTWNVYAFSGYDDDNDLSNNTYRGYYTDENLSFDSESSFDQWEENPSDAETWNGCPFSGTDQFTFFARRQGFPCGEYSISVNKWDDEIWVYIDDTEVFHYNGYSGAANPPPPIALGNYVLGSSSRISIKVAEGGGAANGYLSIVPLSAAPTSISGITATCAGEPFTLTAEGAILGTGASYQWGTGDVGSNIISGETAASITVTPSGPAVYWVRVNYGDCASEAVTHTVTISNTWTGAEDSNWFNANNWSCNSVPDNLVDVNIGQMPYNPVVASGTGLAYTLTIESGAEFTIATGATLEVTDAITNNGTFTIENNAALVQQNNVANTGNVTAIKTANELFRLDYTFWSSPVTGQELQDFSPLTASGRFYTYGNNGTAEAYVQADASGNFVPGVGYLIRMPNQLNPVTGPASVTQDYLDYNAGTYSFAFEGSFNGVPNNGPISVTASTAFNRVNGVGNPYPSPINLEDFFTANQNVLDAAPAVYFWRKRNNGEVSSYASLTLAAFTANAGEPEDPEAEADPDYQYGGQNMAGYYTGDSSEWIIAPGQGFLVQTGTAPTVSDIVFTNDMRRPTPGSSQAFFRTGSPGSISRIWLDLKDSQNGFSQLAIAYKEGATLGLDYGYDGKTINGGGNISFYSLATDTPLAIQARPAFTAEDVVPLGYTAGTAGAYSISMSRAEGVFNEGQQAYIKDNVLGITQNITNSAYNFTTEAGSFTNRFELVYTTNGSLGTENPYLNEATVIVYKEGGAITIQTGNAVMGTVTVYDLQGRTVLTAKDINANKTTLTAAGVQQQVLLIDVNTDKGRAVKKLMY